MTTPYLILCVLVMWVVSIRRDQRPLRRSHSS